MQVQPLISVIIPVYKVEQWLDRCVNSVVSQDYANLQIILVDDGSPDTCGEMCEQWAKKDARIRVIHQENGGLSHARNTGLDVATGSYVMFVDSDDVLHPQICSRLYACLQRSDGQIAICDAAHIFGDAQPEYSLCEERRVFTALEATEEMWYQRSFLPSAWAKLYSAELFKDLRFTKGRLYEDIDVMHLVFAQAQKILYEPSRLYGYVHREDSITTQAFSQRDLDILKVADKLLAYAQTQAPTLLPAARAYACVAALRVELNAPKTEDFTQGHTKAKALLKTYGKAVRGDKNIRRKTKGGLLLYKWCRPLMGVIHKRMNRWK